MLTEDGKSGHLIELIHSSTCIGDRHEHLAYVLDQVCASGLYLEFGVFNGDSINFIADIIAPHLVYGFDSFEGLPEEWRRRKDGSLTFPRGTFAVKSLPKVRTNVRLIKGYFEGTLSPFMIEHPDHVTFINIDSDTYSAAKTILRALNTQIVSGTILYFDEITGWGELVDQYDTWEDGEYKALLEWLAECDREIEPVSRNDRYGAAVRITR